MEKTALQTLIETIDDGGVNTAAEVRAVLNGALDNAYATEIIDTHLTTNVFTKIGTANCEYEIRVIKQGRKVTVTGFVDSMQASLSQFATVTNSEYQPPANFRYGSTNKIFTTLFSLDTNETAFAGIFRATVAGNITAGGIQNGERLRFQFEYNTEN